jgi:hypothetical protein
LLDTGDRYLKFITVHMNKLYIIREIFKILNEHDIKYTLDIKTLYEDDEEHFFLEHARD